MSTDREPGVDLEKRHGDLQAQPVAVPERAAPVLDGELVDDQAGPQPRKRVQLTVVGKAVPDAAAVRKGTWTAGRAVVRHGYVAGRGLVSWAGRAGSASTHGHLREQVRLARAAGDKAALKEWIEQLESSKDARLERLTSLPKLIVSLLIALAIGVGVVLVVLLVLGLAVQLVPGGAGWGDFWDGVGTVVSVISTLVKWAAGIAAAGALPLLGVLAWREGQRVADPPKWLLTVDQRKKLGSEVTPSKVVTALRDLGVSELRKAIKAMDDNGAGMLSPIRIAGCGVEVEVALPSGTSTEEVQKRRRKLAENLDRHEHELHIAIPERARRVLLWIADVGALDEPVGPSPLVLDPAPTADIYTGRAPWGVSLRGDPVALSLLQRHLLVTGLSNQGKTASARALVLWAIFDVVAEFRLADLKGVGDWHMFQPVATVLIEGPSDEHVLAATEMLEAGVEEMERRLQALDKDKYPNGVTRQLAREKGSGFHPLFLVVDEGQQAFMAPPPLGGTKATSRFYNAARKIENQGRAVNVLLWLFTQDPTDANLPVIIREAMHIRASLAVGTESKSKMAVGEKAVDGGAAPHLLRQGVDKGVLVVAGDGVPLAPGQSSVTVRTHFIDGAAATELVRKAIELRRKKGRHLAAVEAPEEQAVDHLADIAKALRGERYPRTTVVLGRLAEDAPGVYEEWTHGRLARVLDEAGAAVGTYEGRKVVRADRVEQALQSRAGDAGEA